MMAPAGAVSALQMPSSAVDLLQMASFSSQAFAVADGQDGRIILSKNADLPWVPASLTKLVTAMVFLDTKPNMNKTLYIKASDQTGGGCSSGGACLSTKPGVAYRLGDLFNASLVASANNATMAVARSTGMTQEEFVKKMNEKARELGASGTVFTEPAGMSPLNVTTASDYVKIAKTALNNPVIAASVAQTSYSFKSVNSRKYVHSLKTTNKLLGDAGLDILGGKTGYLEESKYNFVSRVNGPMGSQLIVVILGSKSSAAEFQETKELVSLGSLALAFFPPANLTAGSVLGTSTAVTLNN